MKTHTKQRRESGISIDQVSSIIGYSPKTIRQYENGTKKPTQRFISLYKAAVEALAENKP